MKLISIVLCIYYLTKGIIGSPLVSGENGLWSLNNSKVEKLGNCKVKDFFKICEDKIYWSDGETVFRGNHFGNETEILIDPYKGICIRSFDVDCSAHKLIILNSCDERVDELNTRTKGIKTLLSGLKSPNRLVLNSAHRQFYLLYERHTERYRYRETLTKEIMAKPDNLRPTALTIHDEVIYIAYIMTNTYYIQKCDLDFTACSNVTSGTGYILNLVIDQIKLFFIESSSETVYEWSLPLHTFINSYEVKQARDIQLSSAERLLSRWWLFVLVAVYTMNL